MPITQGNRPGICGGFTGLKLTIPRLTTVTQIKTTCREQKQNCNVSKISELWFMMIGEKGGGGVNGNWNRKWMYMVGFDH